MESLLWDYLHEEDNTQKSRMVSEQTEFSSLFHVIFSRIASKELTWESDQICKKPAQTYQISIRGATSTTGKVFCITG